MTRPVAGMGNLCSVVAVRSPMAHVRAPDTHDLTLRTTGVRKVPNTASAAVAAAAEPERTKQSSEHGCDSKMGQQSQSCCKTSGYHASGTKGTSDVDNHVCLGIGETRLWSTVSNCLSNLDAG